MKKYLLLIGYGLLLTVFFSCAEIQPVTIGGVENPKLNKLSREGIDAEFGMKIKNPNKKSVTVYPSTFDGTVNGINVGKIKLAKRVKIRANSDNTETFQIKSDFSKLGLEDITQVISMVSSRSATVHLKGEVRAGKWYYKKRFPVELTKTILLSK